MSGVTGKPRQTRLHVLLLAVKSHKKRLGCGHPDHHYRWAPNDRIGKPPACQFLGEGETSRTLSGLLYPEITGGRLSLTAIELMADEGKAWPLIDRTGMIHGMYVIDKVTHMHTKLFSDSAARKIEFACHLNRSMIPSRPYTAA